MARLYISVICVALVTPLPFALHAQQRLEIRTSHAPKPAAASNCSSTAAPLLECAQAAESLSKIPIGFEMNQGQTDGHVGFLAHGAGYSMYLTPSEMVLALRSPRPNPGHLHKPQSLLSRPGERPSPTISDTALVRMRLIGTNSTASQQGIDPLPGKVNYLIGNDPEKWHVNLPTYSKVRVGAVYPGIDLLYYGNQSGQMEHDFLVAPEANPRQISFVLEDRNGQVHKDRGGIRLQTAAGDLELTQPIAYQTIHGRRKMISARYEVTGNNTVRFRIGRYDRHAALVIDPVLKFAAVFGGSADEIAYGLAIDSSQNLYLTGFTYSTDFPVIDAYQSSWTPNSSLPTTTAAFVSKINASGTALLYSTYLGGPSSSASAIAVDGSGRVYVSGATDSGFPTKNAHQPNYGGGDLDAFISVLSPAGNSLEWSTYLGGNQMDYANAMAVDAQGNVYVSGYTYGGFPNLHSFATPGTSGIWVAKFSNAGVLQYSSMFGDILGQSGGVAVDATGAAYIVGYTNRPDLPTTPGAFRSSCAINAECAWAAKFNPPGDSLAYSTYLTSTPSGSASSASALALDSDLNAYIGGAAGPGLPVWSSGFQRTFGGGTWDGFVVKLNATGTNLIWSTYLGGNGNDSVDSLALDRYRNVYVAGNTCSSNFPLKAPIQTWTATAPDRCGMFVTTLSGSLSYIPYYSTYLGTQSGPTVSQTPFQSGIAVDPSLNVYVSGTTYDNLQPTPGALSTGSTKGGSSVFLTKLMIMDDIQIMLSASPTPVTYGSNLTYTIAVTSKGPDFGTNVRLSDTLPGGTTFVSYDAGGGTCTSPPVGSTGTLNCQLPQLDSGATWYVKLTVNVHAPPGVTLSNMAAAISNMQDFVTSNNSASATTPVN